MYTPVPLLTGGEAEATLSLSIEKKKLDFQLFLMQKMYADD